MLELYRKSELDKGEEKDPNARSYKYAYILFKNMKDANTVLDVYNVNPGYRTIINKLCCKCCCAKRQKELDDLLFMGRWLKITRAGEPDEIKWENNGYSGTNILLRKIVVWFIALILLITGIVCIVFITEEANKLKGDFQVDKPCQDEINASNEATFASAAYEDYTQNNDQQGLMNCFCVYQLQTNN